MVGALAHTGTLAHTTAAIPGMGTAVARTVGMAGMAGMADTVDTVGMEVMVATAADMAIAIERLRGHHAASVTPESCGCDI